MLRYIPALLAVLALALAVGGCAGKKTKQTYLNVDQVFAVYDKDNDGKITQAEFTARFQDKLKADQAWKKLDRDNNGFVERTLNNDAPLNVWNEVETQNLP
jgi:Ca2+-binding EF-hand superfamily protein